MLFFLYCNGVFTLYKRPINAFQYSFLHNALIILLQSCQKTLQMLLLKVHLLEWSCLMICELRLFRALGLIVMVVNRRLKLRLLKWCCSLILTQSVQLKQLNQVLRGFFLNMRCAMSQHLNCKIEVIEHLIAQSQSQLI